MTCPICKCETHMTVCPNCGGNVNYYRHQQLTIGSAENREIARLVAQRDELRTESAKYLTALKSLECLHEQTMIVASASNTQKAREIVALKAQRDELAALLRGLRAELADRVPMNCNERFSAVNRIDATLAKVGGA